MNPTKTQILIVDDPFRAAYLLRFGKFRETRIKDGQRSYLIEGDAGILTLEDHRYRTGFARVNPLSLRESFYLLKELSGTDEIDEIELEELTEPIAEDLLEEEKTS